ncbi:hypothetical protein [Blastococcus brunescens]|uniref:Glycosyltransferase subfamily 4-like N-terminal domain-containing protein n=1 Tax=Blastococcus brunescens TaxID=1564165 RepID=A0ABZ1AZE4_9ACTN|nr:hypothetical protein [Blastococcus sp. BMG 8361]WRL63291.1 hypothetical protein U6N30_26600 [Blastococcus sp. BMG 8361]
MAVVPFSDAYVDAVLPPEVVRVGPSDEFSPWLDHAHLVAHAAEIDVLHLHTGQAHVAASAVQCWAETVRRLGIPLVVTVHGVGAQVVEGAAPGTRPWTHISRPCCRPPRWCSR